MPRPELTRVPEFYHNYIKQVPENDIMEALNKQTPAYLQFLKDIPTDKRGYRYGPDKWTIQEALQHILDAERVFAYRALCFARKETTSLPSFDENDYANNAKADKRNWEDMVEEFKAIRKSTEILFGSFDNEQLENEGTANGRSNYVLGWGFILVGHAYHHMKIIKERYL